MTEVQITNEDILRMTEARCRVKRCCNSSVRISDDKILIVAPNIEIKHVLPFKQLMENFKDPMRCLEIVIAVGLSNLNLEFMRIAAERRLQDREEKP